MWDDYCHDVKEWDKSTCDIFSILNHLQISLHADDRWCMHWALQQIEWECLSRQWVSEEQRVVNW